MIKKKSKEDKYYDILLTDIQMHVKKDPKRCDMIICWEDDWKDKPKNLKVVELKKELGKII